MIRNTVDAVGTVKVVVQLWAKNRVVKGNRVRVLRVHRASVTEVAARIARALLVVQR